MGFTFRGFFIHLNIYMENSSSLTLEDLSVIKSIIETASTRGAFKAQELKSVGMVYEKLDLFLKTVVSQAEAQAQAQTPTQGETE